VTARRWKQDSRSGDVHDNQRAPERDGETTGSAAGSGSSPQVPVCRLQLGDRLEARLGTLVCAGYPEETCGLLLGHRNAVDVEILDLVEVRNLDRERAHDRYELDPDGYVAADLEAREQGCEIVGIWHSHPDHPAKPSATDRERAWEGWSYLIASVTRDGVVELRSWHLHEGDFLEEVVK
jgi:proteasome lid subunit RPN8/RPN11